MILLLKASCGESEVKAVIEKAESLGLNPELSRHGTKPLIILHGSKEALVAGEFLTFGCVERAIPLTEGPGLAGRETHSERTVVRVGEAEFGSGNLEVIAGPCSVESLEQTLVIARAVQQGGALIFRGGAYKPRTSPYSFQGLGEEGLKILAKVRDETGLIIATEAMDTTTIDLVARYTDIIQIGSRNMQNTPLLKAAGRQGKPIILKRGMAATLDEWLLAAEYILSQGNDQVILCERGVRTFSDHSRFTLDLGIIPALRERTHLPVIVDPSHGTGKRSHVPAMALAAVAAGADGVMVEVHSSPDESVSDSAQTVDFETFSRLMTDLNNLAKVLGRQF